MLEFQNHTFWYHVGTNLSKMVKHLNHYKGSRPLSTSYRKVDKTAPEKRRLKVLWQNGPTEIDGERGWSLTEGSAMLQSQQHRASEEQTQAGSELHIPGSPVRNPGSLNLLCESEGKGREPH